VVFGLGGIGLNVIQGARMAGADMIVGVDINPARKALAEKFGMTHFVNPKEVEGDLVALSRRADQGRRRLQFRVHRQCRRDAPGAGMLPSRLGRVGHHRRRRRRPGDQATRPFQLVTGRVWKGTAFGGAKRAHRCAEDRRLVHGRQDQHRRPDHPHVMPLEEDQRPAFDLMHNPGRVDPQRFAKREYAHWETEHKTNGLETNGGSFDDSVLPIVEAGRAVMIESDHQPDPLLTIKDYPGHTPGSIAINLKDQGRQACFSGDIMHHPIQVYHPDWSSQFCWDQAMSAVSRRKLLEDCVESNALLCPAHFPGANAGYVKPEGNSFKIEWDRP
jgi:hypothetical protein